MSVRVMTASWAANLPAGDKLVLLALADCANDEGHCWPGLVTLCEKTGRCRRSLQESLRALAAAGHITRVENPGKGMNYTVHPVANPATGAKSAPVAKSAATGSKSCHRGVAKSAPKPSKNRNNRQEGSSNDDSSSADKPLLRPEHVFEFYQEMAAAMGRPVPRDLTPERREKIRSRIAQHPLDDFHEVFARCRGSPFLRGDKGRTPLTVDWLFKKGNFQKVLEGNYDG